MFKKEKAEMRRNFEIAVKAWRGDSDYERKVTEMA